MELKKLMEHISIIPDYRQAWKVGHKLSDILLLTICTQKGIAEKIQKQGGGYLFAAKGNQGRVNKAFEEKFPLKELNNPEHDSYAISEKSHGREETRLHIVCDVPDELIDFTFE